MDESQCRSCSPGFYCSETGLSAVSGPCLPGQTENLVVSVIWKCSLSNILLKCFSPGFYCLERSETATPMSSASGGVCPAGHYCAEGSSVPSPCPAGSYQNETGGKGKDDCKPCPLGKKEVTLYEFNSAKLTFICTIQIPSPSLKMSSMFEWLCQAGSRICRARESVIPVLLGSTASPWVPAPPALCPAQLATSVPGRVQTVSLSPAPKAPTAPVRVSPPQVKTKKLCEKREQVELSCTIVWLFSCLKRIWRLIRTVNDLLRQMFCGVTLDGFIQLLMIFLQTIEKKKSEEIISPVFNKIKQFQDFQNLKWSSLI